MSCSNQSIDILLIGLGSVGSIYAYLLERSGRARVTAVARSNYDLYVRSGVRLKTDRFGVIDNWRPSKVVRSLAEALAIQRRYSFCVICTKCLPDVQTTPQLVEEVIASGKVDAWALIQNGLEVEADLYNATKHLDTPIISNMAWIGIMTAADGTVVWRSIETMVSGIYPPLDPPNVAVQSRTFSEKEVDALKLWCDVLRAGDANVCETDHVDSIRFSKNVWNCAWSSIQGLSRATPEKFAALPPPCQAPIKAFIREIVMVGFKSGLLRQGMIQYPGKEVMGDEDQVVDHAWERITQMAIAKVEAGGPAHKMSLLVDVEMCRPFEVEVITGSVLRLARSHNLHTPLLEFTYALLKGLQAEIMAKPKIH